MILLRVLGGVGAAAVYQVATNPFVQAVGLSFAGRWAAAAWLLAAWCAAHALAVALSRWTLSPLTGLAIRTAPRFLWVLGNDQDGYLSRWGLHPTWRWWAVAFAECAWRNKLRNLPFVSWLRWLHVPHGTLITREVQVLGLTLRMRARGWMTELEWIAGRHFGDIGPRLDQPDAWGGVSWAFRLWGRS